MMTAVTFWKTDSSFSEITTHKDTIAVTAQVFVARSTSLRRVEPWRGFTLAEGLIIEGFYVSVLLGGAVRSIFSVNLV